MEEYWEAVEDALSEAVAFTWDECHKIYVMMDETQVAKMVGYGYDPIVRVNNAQDALATIKKWYEESCGLKFICAISSEGEEFADLIPQGVGWEEEDK